jgi:hypothetical protein
MSMNPCLLCWLWWPPTPGSGSSAHTATLTPRHHSTGALRLSIYNNYIGETHYKSWIDFSQHASIPRYHPLYTMSPSTTRHVIIHQTSIHVFKRFSMVNNMYLWVAHHKNTLSWNTCRIIQLRMVSLSTKYHAFMYNVVYKWMLSCNYFGFLLSYFTLKIYLKNFHSNTRGIT